MQADGESTNITTGVPMPERTTTNRTTTKEQIGRLKSIQKKVWAILGLKMAVDQLESLGYQVVVHQEGNRTTIELDLQIGFDMKTGMIGGKDIDAVQNALEAQIKTLEEQK